MSEAGSSTGSAASFRLPRTTYAVVFFLVVGMTPIALYGGYEHPTEAAVSPLTLLYLIPLLSIVFIARTSTTVDPGAIVVTALFGRRRIGWDEVRGLSVTGRNIYAVTSTGSVRLACVRQGDLTAVARASGGRLPELPEAPPKFAPSAHRR